MTMGMRGTRGICVLTCGLTTFAWRILRVLMHTTTSYEKAILMEPWSIPEYPAYRSSNARIQCWW